ncbi:DNA helicase/exodeoxyribonuclease V, subunit A [Alteribacillus persepolensis]|uniref:ATP-dependent helicase/nuclease subunit A n=1 Tax=Alteribacillus persepolensis TaxID=568899 RepID=A0A1G7Z8E1_9BACI|nr:helicase-exonuclease AddAB subunit AddA [Alteribacillus persepolensis]SDH04867.1 DNA helicase/exodeoxyribonuclease V, subunit A [Alteribacillus persepolensis]
MKLKWKQKPEGAFWTDSQWEAVSGSGSNQLVSAAAGSGKTAVLVERIIHKITDQEHPVDMDRLLIVTFTNAAAAEMKNRIAEALEAAINEKPGSLYLRRQLALLNKAQISTLHAFCMSLVRKYYYKLNIDPKFRIIDDIEGELLREEILDGVFESQYSKENNEAFLDASERFSGDKSDEGFKQVVREVYRFSQAHPDPEKWLQDMAACYEVTGVSQMEDTPWGKEVLENVKTRLSASIDMLQQAISLCQEEGGPLAYEETLLGDKQMLEELYQATNWDTLYTRFQDVVFKRLKTVKKSEDIDETLKTRVKDMRDAVKKDVTDMKTETFTASPADLLRDIKEMAEPVHALVSTVSLFSNRYQLAKTEKGVVDFSDLEHFTLRILQEEGSEAAEQYRSRFDEVLVDEYQDTNLIQEAILRHISKGDNLFLVGDVKQSIYRFRLAEPSLFLDKYKQYNRTDGQPGWKVNLDQNFRSRQEVLQASNFIFKQLMDEKVGDIVYDETAELKTGNTDYPDNDEALPELTLINKGDPINTSIPDEEQEDSDTASLEARWIARKIKNMIKDGYQVLDKETKAVRKMTYRDVVILMRSMPWAAVMMDEFKKEGLPVYAEVSGGYFQAVEINIMLSLLQVIDNPRQDIALAAVLRSPIVGMDEEELAKLRLCDPKGMFFDALKQAAHAVSTNHEAWQEKAQAFYEKLCRWRERARNEALPKFIWDLFQETGYYDFVGGLPGGKQRQANLTALYDRARTYEKTSFRGLFRFLRFIERMQERGDDFGTARALGEQEDVVRIMTIHKSKGLEFPVVFIAGMNKSFNLQDTYRSVLLHKELGIGAKTIDPIKRVMKSSVAQQAVKHRIHRESLSEEMRVLYVAMTRAKEKLCLVGTVKNPEKTLAKWAQYKDVEDWLLPERDRVKAASYADWIGPAIFRHQSADSWYDTMHPSACADVYHYPVNWRITLVEQRDIKEITEADELENNETMTALKERKPVLQESVYKHAVEEKLNWSYPYQAAVTERSKKTVSEFKRAFHDEYSEPVFQPEFHAQYAERPLFMQEKNTRPEEKGTAVHTVMEHLPLNMETVEDCQMFIDTLVGRELLTEDQKNMVDAENIMMFLSSALGKRLTSAAQVFREIPFSYGMQTDDGDTVLIQGAVDCVFRDKEGQLVLIDYKTDAFQSRYPGNRERAEYAMREKYQSQLDVYRQALSAIWQEEVAEAYLYIFDGHCVIDMMK